jgi:hypothetical protein
MYNAIKILIDKVIWKSWKASSMIYTDKLFAIHRY